jgi:UDP-glucose 6-dehydrogenase
MSLVWQSWSRKTLPRAGLPHPPSTAEAIANADVALLCVGTPSERNGNLSLDQLRRAIPITILSGI